MPPEITKVFRSTTGTGNVIPRIFVDGTAEDKADVEEVLKRIAMYPLDQFDGRMKAFEWSRLKTVPSRRSGDGETPWVVPSRFFDVLPAALADTPPLPGEEARYAQLLSVVDAARTNPDLRKIMNDEAAKAEQELIIPLFHFRNWGLQLPFHWSTMSNGAAFGTDYFTRRRRRNPISL